MRRNGIAVLMMIVLLLVPAAACALGVSVSEEAKAACLQEAGELLGEPYGICVVSPYGTQSVVLRDAPSDSYHAVAMLMVGQEMTVVGESEAFVFVYLDELTYGWLAEDEVTKADP